MGADRQEFDHGRLIEAQSFNVDHSLFRDADELGHAAVDMHAHHPDIDAAVRLGLAASDAVAARQIGINGDALARLEGGIGIGRLDLAGQFVAHHAGIVEEGLIAAEDVKVGAT